jgi:hypothetical protein
MFDKIFDRTKKSSLDYKTNPYHKVDKEDYKNESKEVE